jgi:hypothetical protein
MATNKKLKTGIDFKTLPNIAHSPIKTPMDQYYNIGQTNTLSTSTIYEDSTTCVVLAQGDSTKVRTKHLAIKLHHFKDEIWIGHIKITKIYTPNNH